MSESRKRKSLKNIIIAFFSNILVYALSLFTSRIIKQKLGLEILGLNGVLNNVISLLSLTELGIGTAITFALYEPLAKDDKETIRSLMTFYKKAYNYVAISVFTIGIILLPFIPFIIKQSNFSNSYIRIVYILFLINSVSSYLLIYKRTLIIADQKNYVITSITLVYSYILKISQLIVVYITSNYIFYLSIQIVYTIIYNLYISNRCNKLYPYIKEKSEKLPVQIYNTIMTKIKALFLHSIGAIIVTGTDNLLISFFCGIVIAGKYTSYFSIIVIISTLIGLVFDNIKDSLGNFLVTASKEKQLDLFENLIYLNQTLVSVCGVCLLILLSPFIKLWLGDDTLLSQSTVFLMVISFYITRNQSAIGSLRIAAGIFEEDKFVPLIESVINLTTSIILSKYIGINGIIVGTIISTILCPFLVQPIIMYKKLFSITPKTYFFNYLTYFIRFLIIYFLFSFIVNHLIRFEPNNILFFLLEALLLFILILASWFILTFWKKETKFYLNLFFSKFRKSN